MGVGGLEYRSAGDFDLSACAGGGAVGWPSYVTQLFVLAHWWCPYH